MIRNILAFVVLAYLASTHEAASTIVKLLVPMYEVPRGPLNDPTYFQYTLDMFSFIADSLTIVSIINPANGPGNTHLNSSWIKALTAIQEVYINSQKNTHSYMIGYVDTKNGTRDIDEVKRDVDTYASWSDEYRPSGIFFDRVPATIEKLSYYQELYQHVKSNFGESSRVFTSHGENFAPEYLCSMSVDQETRECPETKATDTGVTFVGSHRDWMNFSVQNSNSFNRDELGVFITRMPTINASSLSQKRRIVRDTLIKALYVNDRNPNQAGFIYLTEDASITNSDIFSDLFQILIESVYSFGYNKNEI